MKDEVKFRKREEKLSQKWDGVSEMVPIDGSQYALDTKARKDEFIKAQFPTEDEMKRYKEYRSEWFRRAKEFDPGDAPLAVVCELVSTCNLDCPMCYTITEEFQSSAVGAQRKLPWEIVTKVIDECAELGVSSMLFSWRGESAIYRATDKATGEVKTFADVLAYARKKGILEITSLTNGSMFGDKMIADLVDAEPTWISFSIDGLGKNYNKIRTPVSKKDTDFNAFEEVMGNLKAIVALRDKLGKTRPQIRTNTIYPPIHENPLAYQKFMQEAGVGWVTVNEILDFRQEDLPDEDVKDDWACQYPFQRLTVSANGSILPCTGAHNEEDELLLGRYTGSKIKKVQSKTTKLKIWKQIDYSEMTLKEAWDCEKLKNIRKMHMQNERKCISACRNCRHGAIKKGVDWVPEDWNMETMEWEDHDHHH